MNDWKKVESKIFKFEKKGDSIEGKLISKDKGSMFDNEVYKIEKGKEVYTVFSTTVMQSQMVDVEVGQEVKIVFVGTKENTKTGQNDIKLFEVYTK